MGVKVTNNAYGTLSASISTSDTTITLDSGQGSRFPSLGASDYFYGTLVDTSNNIEVVKVTARSTDSMTVVRGADNTTATAFAIGDRFELRPTAALFEAIQDEASVDGITSSAAGTAITIDSSDDTTIENDLQVDGTLNVTGTTTTGDASLNGAVVINEAGADKDFRVESDTQTHQFWIDAGNNRTVFGGSGSNQGDIQYNCDSIWHIATSTTHNYATDGNTDSTPNFKVVVDDEGTTKGRMRFYGYTGSIQELMQIQSDTGSTAGGTTGKAVGFGHAGVWFDRGWGNRPALTVCSVSSTGQTTQDDIRVHGTNATWSSYPDASGSDFSTGVYIDGSFTNASDRRYKRNITSITNALDIVQSMDGRRFQTIDRAGNTETNRSQANGFKYGFIGQELEEAGVGEIYKYYAEDDDGTDGYNKAYGVDYASVVALLTNAIKEQQVIIDDLKARIEVLEGE